MHILKTALGSCIGVLAALLAYDAITAYRLSNPAIAARLGLRADVVASEWRHREPQRPDDLRTVQRLANPPAGTIEWTARPDSRVEVPWHQP